MARLEGHGGSSSLCCVWAAVLLTVACLYLGQVPFAGAIEAPCTACKAVAAELQGKRYGKVIPYKHSEQRAVELLDGLCGAMHDYTLVSVTHNETGKKTIHWAKHRGDGAHEVPKEQRPPTLEEDAHKKRLEVYCGNMMEEHEEHLYEGITKDIFDEKGVEAPLCYKMTSSCPKHDVSHKRPAEPAGETGGTPAVEL